MIKAVIFDFDGVIVDTMDLHYRSWDVVAQSLGGKLNDTIRPQFKGASRFKSLNAVLEFLNVESSLEDREKLAQLKDLSYQREMEGIDDSLILDGLRDTLESLKQKGIKMAIASASRNAKSIIHILELQSYFDVMLDANDVKETKPDPRIFLECSKALNIPPEECLIVEDSALGIEAAQSAHFHTLGIVQDRKEIGADKHIPSWTNFSIVDYISGLKERV